MSETENKDVAVTETAPVVASEPAANAVAPAPAEIKPNQSAKAAPATQHAPRKLDKFAERRAQLKRQKRVAHRRRIAASNTPG